MMQHTPAHTRPCPNCDGHATAAITTGSREIDGTRSTLTANCPACHGTGTTPRSVRVTSVGR